MAESSALIVAHGSREMAAFLGVPPDERLLDADLTNLPTPRSIRCFERGEYQHGAGRPQLATRATSWVAGSPTVRSSTRVAKSIRRWRARPGRLGRSDPDRCGIPGTPREGRR